ncbi:BTB/POZ domain-containing protein 6-B-like [Haemaphysalis longicornis]
MFELNFKRFLATGLYADVEFAVKPDAFPLSKTFKAHKQFLAMRNEQFAAMFYGKEAQNGTVVITDLHPDGFYGLMKYLYLAKVKVKSIEEAVYTRSAARKYKVPELELACSLYINIHVSAENVCFLIDDSVQGGALRVDSVVDLMLKKQSLEVLNSEAFANCLEQTVHYVLEKVTEVPEICVVYAVHRWAQDACQKRATTDEKQDLKTIMAPFLAKLRFLALTPEEFITIAGTWDVLDKDDAFAILSLLISNESISPPSWMCQEKSPR